MPDDVEKLQVCSWRNEGNGAFQSSFKKSNGDRISIKENDTHCMIRIERVKEEDVGTWGCQIRYQNKNGESVEWEYEWVFNVDNFSAENSYRAISNLDLTSTQTWLVLAVLVYACLAPWYAFKQVAQERSIAQDGILKTIQYFLFILMFIPAFPFFWALERSEYAKDMDPIWRLLFTLMVVPSLGIIYLCIFYYCLALLLFWDHIRILIFGTLLVMYLLYMRDSTTDYIRAFVIGFLNILSIFFGRNR